MGNGAEWRGGTRKFIKKLNYILSGWRKFSVVCENVQMGGCGKFQLFTQGPKYDVIGQKISPSNVTYLGLKVYVKKLVPKDTFYDL